MLNNKFYSQVKQFLVDYNLIGKKILLSVSGGVDSMVLLHILAELDLTSNFVVYFDHQVRPDTYKDIEVIESFCKLKKIQFEVVKLNFKTESNFEEQARVERYKNLELIASKNQIDLIVTGHHQDDKVETILQKFLKGTFITGLVGIKSYDLNRKLGRPLLGFSKSEIRDFASEQKIDFREDSSNSELKYDRNFLRNEIVPKLDSRFAGFQKQILEKVPFYEELDEFLEKQAQDFLMSEKRYLGEFGVYEVEKIVELPRFLRFEWLKLRFAMDFSVARYLEFEKFLLKAQNGKYFEINGIRLEKSFDYLVFVPVDFDVVRFLNQKKVNPFELEISDLSKYLYEKKIPVFIRENLEVENLSDSKIRFFVDIEKFVLNSDNIG